MFCEVFSICVFSIVTFIIFLKFNFVCMCSCQTLPVFQAYLLEQHLCVSKIFTCCLYILVLNLVISENKFRSIPNSFLGSVSSLQIFLHLPYFWTFLVRISFVYHVYLFEIFIDISHFNIQWHRKCLSYWLVLWLSVGIIRYILLRLLKFQEQANVLGF